MEKTNVWAAAESALKVPQKYGFTYEYTYDKGSDSSCVYIHRFKKGADRFELRVLSGAESVSVVAYAGGEYKFPDLKKKYKKLWRASARGRGIARLFSKRTQKQIWDFYAAALEKEAESGTVAVRRRDKGDTGAVSVEEFTAAITKEIADKTAV